METFIVVMALAAAVTGALVLLATLAGKRAQLIKAFNIQQEIARRDNLVKAHPDKSPEEAMTDMPNMATS